MNKHVQGTLKLLSTYNVNDVRIEIYECEDTGMFMFEIRDSDRRKIATVCKNSNVTIDLQVSGDEDSFNLNIKSK